MIARAGSDSYGGEGLCSSIPRKGRNDRGGSDWKEMPSSMSTLVERVVGFIRTEGLVRRGYGFARDVVRDRAKWSLDINHGASSSFASMRADVAVHREANMGSLVSAAVVRPLIRDDSEGAAVRGHGRVDNRRVAIEGCTEGSSASSLRLKNVFQLAAYLSVNRQI